MAKTKKFREDHEIRYSEELKDLIKKAATQVDNERLDRIENHSQITERFQSETVRVSGMFDLEKKVREETQNTLIRLIDEMEKKLQKEIVKEQDDRMENEAQFMDLLERTCMRIESGIPQ